MGLLIEQVWNERYFMKNGKNGKYHKKYLYFAQNYGTIYEL